MEYAREMLIAILIYHQRMDNTGCRCGWIVLGASYAEHVAHMYERAMTVDTVPL